MLDVRCQMLDVRCKVLGQGIRLRYQVYQDQGLLGLFELLVLLTIRICQGLLVLLEIIRVYWDVYWDVLGMYQGLFNIIANYLRVKIVGIGWCDEEEWGLEVGV